MNTDGGAPAAEALLREGPVVLFDGTCRFCDRTVQFVLDHERDHDLRFASIQSDAIKTFLQRALGEARALELQREVAGDGDPETLVVVDGDQVFTYSSAALRIARHLKAPWRWLGVSAIVPRIVRDAGYRWFARHRYRWYGRMDTCRVPSPHFRSRFL
jgi:predicted DCC family thiol-disulfide oxidoreductase YuxK